MPEQPFHLASGDARLGNHIVEVRLLLYKRFHSLHGLDQLRVPGSERERHGGALSV